MSHPLYVAFVWHMHQPYYKDFASGEYILPWARLHGCKEYIHMAEVLAQYPEVKATFNFVPCLVEQIQEYAHDGAVDRALGLSRQATWSDEDKAYLLSFFFSVNWERVVRRYPRYSQLLELRHQARGDHRLLGQDFYRDLVAWFNLVWLDHDAALKHLPQVGGKDVHGQAAGQDVLVGYGDGVKRGHQSPLLNLPLNPVQDSPGRCQSSSSLLR